MHREDQGAVLHCNSSSGTLECHPPVLPLDLPGDVDRAAPGLSVVGAFHQDHLPCRNRVIAVGDIIEGVPVPEPVRPERADEDCSCPVIHEHRRVAASVLPLWKSSPFTHIDYCPHLLPGPPSVGAAAHSHINVVLEVIPGCVPDVIHGNQRAFRSGGQSRNPVGEVVVIQIVAKCYPEPMSLFIPLRDNFCHSCDSP